MNQPAPGVLSEHAERQAAVWGTDPQTWAELSESQNLPLFTAVLDAADVSAETRLLDVGCGTGRLLALAGQRGAHLSGLDVARPLLDQAATLVADADLIRAELDVLPYEAASFDAVTGVNAFQFAADPRAAFREAARVLTPGGRLVVSLFAEPERSESTVIHHALSALAPPEATGSHAPYLLSEPRNLDAALTDAGFELLDSGDVTCVWAYNDPDQTVQGLLASAGGARAVSIAGRRAAATAVRTAIAPYVQPDGSVRMRNTFRWRSAYKPNRRTP